MRRKQKGFTLMELIIAIALTAALITGLAAFLHAIVLTGRHVAPRVTWVRQLLLVNDGLRHELAAARPGDVALSTHRLIFISRAAYRALPPGRYLYRYVFHPSDHTLSLTLLAVLPHHKPGRTLFRGVLLRNLAMARFAGLLRPARTQEPHFWLGNLKRHKTGDPTEGPRPVLIRLDIEGGHDSIYQHLPPLLYALARP